MKLTLVQSTICEGFLDQVEVTHIDTVLHATGIQAK